MTAALKNLKDEEDRATTRAKDGSARQGVAEWIARGIEFENAQYVPYHRYDFS